jgi:hypothetical protein
MRDTRITWGDIWSVIHSVAFSNAKNFFKEKKIQHLKYFSHDNRRKKNIFSLLSVECDCVTVETK